MQLRRDAVGDDGSCEYPRCQGCTDEEACNFDPNALIADDSCLFPDAQTLTHATMTQTHAMTTIV